LQPGDHLARRGRLDRVPLEYSIEWLTCAIGSRPGAVMAGWPVLLKIVYLLVRQILGLAVLIFRGDGAREAELPVLRHDRDSKFTAAFDGVFWCQ
jgi:hypothetical protein